MAVAPGGFAGDVLLIGQSVVFADRLEPLGDIVARIEEEAAEALDRLAAFRAVRSPCDSRGCR